jgi:elongation factor G
MPETTGKTIGLSMIRNIGVIAHIDAGKTTLTERFLYYTGKTHRIGNIDSGTTVMDYLDEERNRGITIVSAAASFNWQHENDNYLVHLIDTPGHIDFTAEVERSIRVSDGALVIFSGVEGVEAQSEKVWRQSEHYNVPKIAFVNKLDRLGASFRRTFDEIVDKFPQVKAIPMQIPIGIESDLQGIIDLTTMQALYFDGEDGGNIRIEEIPAEMLDEAEFSREEMISGMADFSDEIAALYLEEAEIPADLLRSEIRRFVICGIICPIFCGSAKSNIGVQPVLDAVIDFLPSPHDRYNCHGKETRTGKDVEVNVDDPQFCGLVFKLVAGPSADMLYMRTYSGQLKLNDMLVNSRTGKKVKIKRILRLYSKSIESVEEVGPGDIIGIMGPTETFTGDTLCAPQRQVELESIDFPEPVISIAVEPKSSRDRDKLEATLQMLCREDPTLDLKHHEGTGQLILSGMGELHLEINSNRIHNEFKIEARYGKPRVAYRETIREACTITGIFDRTIGDTELYTEVDIELTPVQLEQGLEVSMIPPKGRNVPNAWINAAVETMSNGLKSGGNLGYSLIYIRGVIKEIRGTPEKTTEGSVAGAILNALQKAIGRGTVLLEPLMKLEITAPDDVIGEITGYLQMRRALIHGIDNVPGGKKLNCEVPLAEMFGFSSALPKLSGGRAGFSMEPHGYQEISRKDLQKATADRGYSFS